MCITCVKSMIRFRALILVCAVLLLQLRSEQVGDIIRWEVTRASTIGIESSSGELMLYLVKSAGAHRTSVLPSYVAGRGLAHDIAQHTLTDHCGEGQEFDCGGGPHATGYVTPAPQYRFMNWHWSGFALQVGQARTPRSWFVLLPDWFIAVIGGAAFALSNVRRYWCDRSRRPPRRGYEVVIRT